MIHTEIKEERPLNNYVTLKSVIADETINGIHIPVDDRFKTGIGHILNVSPDLVAKHGKHLGIVSGDKVRHKLRLGVVCDQDTFSQTVIIEYAYLLTKMLNSGEESPLNDLVVVSDLPSDDRIEEIYVSDADKLDTAIATVCAVSELFVAGLSKHYKDVLKPGETIRYKKEKAVVLPSLNGESRVLIPYSEIMCRV